MQNLIRNPENFIVDLNNTPYIMDLSPITVGNRKLQAYIAMPLGIIGLLAGLIFLPILIILAIPFLLWSAYLLYTRHVVTYHSSHAEIFTRDPMNEGRTETLFYQNFNGVQVGTKTANAQKKHAIQDLFTLTLVHTDPALCLPLLNLPDGNRAYSLSALYAKMMKLPVLQAKLYANGNQN